MPILRKDLLEKLTKPSELEEEVIKRNESYIDKQLENDFDNCFRKDLAFEIEVNFKNPNSDSEYKDHVRRDIVIYNLIKSYTKAGWVVYESSSNNCILVFLPSSN